MTSHKTRKWIKIIFITLFAIVFGALILLWVASELFDKKITALVENRLQKVLPPDVKLEFARLDVDLFRGNITIDSVTAVVGRNDTAAISHHHSFHVNELRIAGVSLWRLLANRVSVDQVSLSDGFLNLSKSLLEKQDSSTQSSKDNSKWKSIKVDEFVMDSIQITVIQDTSDVVEALLNVIVEDIAVPLSNGLKLSDIEFALSELTIKKIHLAPTGSMYTASIASIASAGANQFMVDSVVLDPVYPKFEFSRRVGKQTDRINLAIPRIEFHDFPLEQIKHKQFRAGKITVQNASLKTFRDKRVPFQKDHTVPLPFTAFTRIPLHINIDTIELKTAFVEYEEFPEEGDSSGAISFEDLYATFYRCNNRPEADNNQGITLDVQTAFMGAGLLKASFGIPYDTVNVRYTAGGKFSDFDLTRLNPAIRHLAKMSVTSGHLTEMDFDFSYDLNQSDGSVVMSYENLKIAALTEDSDKNFFSKLKTFLINTFIVKKDKDEDVKLEKKTGEIAFERDPKRSIFNYWWKSLLSGIKSSYGVEDLMPTKPKSKTS